MNTVWLGWYFGPKRNIFPRKLAPLPGIWPGACAIPLTGPINWHSTAIVWRFNCLVFLMLMMVQIRAQWFQIIDMDSLASPQTGPITERNILDNMAFNSMGGPSYPPTSATHMTLWSHRQHFERAQIAGLSHQKTHTSQSAWHICADWDALLTVRECF